MTSFSAETREIISNCYKCETAKDKKQSIYHSSLLSSNTYKNYFPPPSGFVRAYPSSKHIAYSSKKYSLMGPFKMAA